ncbi:MAG: transglycosylase SLT domain-containing protein [Bryobacteraceae bacterium]
MQDTPATILQSGWLTSLTHGIRHQMGEGPTTVGRGPENDVVLQGAEAASVSLRHFEIRREDGGFRIRDLDSTNGTYLNGERITEAGLQAPASIRLGNQGPELTFTSEEPGPSVLDQTLVIPEELPPAPASPPHPVYENLLSEAVERARHARHRGVGDQTLEIMRETLHAALRHTSHRLHLTIAVLTVGLVAVTGAAAWKIAALNREKASIDRRIRETEAKLQKAVGSPAESDRLIGQLSEYQSQAEQLERSVFYRLGPHQQEDFLTREIRALMAEFGAEVYSVPPDFVERVRHYIEQYQGPNRSLISRALTSSASELTVIHQVLAREELPPDLAYIPIVESALAPNQSSAAGAAGPWQLTATTAKAFGLRVDGTVDERFNLRKSTAASCRFLRSLILDFGTGSSVMLALAAYNSGPAKVKQAVSNNVRDPIKQRNFWYLYRIHALPEETRQYVPKVVAAMIIGRNPSHFGF